LAEVLPNQDNVETRIAVHPAAGIAAWGGEVVEIHLDARSGGGQRPTVWSQVVLRVDERRAAKALGANMNVDAVGLLVKGRDGSHFTLLEPNSANVGQEAGIDTVELADVETSKQMLRRQMSRLKTAQTLSAVVGAVLPGELKTLAKGAKKAAQVTAAISGEVRGADRQAWVPMDVSLGDSRLVMLAPTHSREEAVRAAQQHARALVGAKAISELECSAVIESLERLDRVADLVNARGHWAWQLRERLRFVPGQRDVIQQIVNGDVPWDFDEAALADKA
jgi:hypothetical protein